MTMVLRHFLSSSEGRRRWVLLAHHLSRFNVPWGPEVGKADDLGLAQSKGVCSD